MKLYFSPGACSLAPHIALREAKIDFELVKTNTRDRTTSDGSDWLAVNPKGYVPALKLDDGEVLTEVAAILQYIADRSPGSGLAPTAGSMDRYRFLEWLNFIATELHKGFAPMFRPGVPEEFKVMSRERLELRFDWLAGKLGGREYLVGKQFSVADAYLFVILGWARAGGIDRSKFPVLNAYHARIGERPAVVAAREAEGLK